MVNNERLVNKAMSLVVGEMIMTEEALRRLVMITIVWTSRSMVGCSLFYPKLSR